MKFVCIQICLMAHLQFLGMCICCMPSLCGAARRVIQTLGDTDHIVCFRDCGVCGWLLFGQKKKGKALTLWLAYNTVLHAYMLFHSEVIYGPYQAVWYMLCCVHTRSFVLLHYQTFIMAVAPEPYWTQRGKSTKQPVSYSLTGICGTTYFLASTMCCVASTIWAAIPKSSVSLNWS